MLLHNCRVHVECQSLAFLDVTGLSTNGSETIFPTMSHSHFQGGCGLIRKVAPVTLQKNYILALYFELVAAEEFHFRAKNLPISKFATTTSSLKNKFASLLLGMSKK